MKLTILSKPSGEIYSAMYGEYDDQPDSLVIDFDENIELLFNEYMVFEGQLLHIGPRPTLFHFPDITTRGWLPNLDAARESKRQQVDAELGIRLYLPCNGFDADEISRERISGMIARLQRGDGLPTDWMGWRDADNNLHWAADDAATVLANL